MTDIQLQELEVSNFRSIKGMVRAPLDAKVILVHGENGAGKTSLLSAIETALTGRVVSLGRADPQYQKQLLHCSAERGHIDLRTLGLAGGNHFHSVLTRAGVEPGEKLPAGPASFFSERCYLPQSFLGQLLQIYQDSDSAPNSPLSRFVNELLGLDRLDAIETGLLPAADIRNLRKTTDRYGQVEYEKTRLERTLSEHRGARDAAAKIIAEALGDLNLALAQLELLNPIDETRLDLIEEAISQSPEDAQLNDLAGQRRQVLAVQQEAVRNVSTVSQQDETSLSEAHGKANSDLQGWQREFENVFSQLRDRVTKILPDVVLSQADPEAMRLDALKLLRARKVQLNEREVRAAQDTKRESEVTAELIVAGKHLTTIDGEIGRIATNSGNLAAALAELSSFVLNDHCPVCDRDFAEKGQGPLTEHLNHKVRTLSGSAERLLGLSTNRAEQQVLVERLEREATELKSRLLEPKALADLERESADVDALVVELDQRENVAREGSRRAAVETATRRALAGHQSADLARTATMATLTELTETLGQAAPELIATPQSAIVQLLDALDQRTAALNTRVSARRTAKDALRRIRAEVARREFAEKLIRDDTSTYSEVESALSKANGIRADAQKIRAKVEVVRSLIIVREFNERLNRLWRDLFVRLAPNEPFVPAFRIPSESTHRLNPKLITTHRSGGAGGTPGAMLSAGNLNTAALTLFIALHLSVAPQLPWLILDDPVQSMDDVHIAHFAALLRTLSKGQKRQVIVAVHDRQLFEYLRLELSPAFAGDSLLSLELSRGPKQDTRCLPDRRSFKEETALRSAA
ncbi:AAA family ATPase [Mesorhizobium sp. M0244]|uniref:AAA family ATPase n=1 Tax=Mesorhizobium sp. M0244 TaxID=2956926 RepID=UPI00333B575C